MTRLLAIVGALGVLLVILPAYAHSGGTNASGCHTRHSDGTYHCHGGASRQPSAAPSARRYCHVLRGQFRCGYARSTCRSLRSTYGGYCASE